LHTEYSIFVRKQMNPNDTFPDYILVLSNTLKTFCRWESLWQNARYNQASDANRRKSASSEMIRKLLLLVSEYRDLIFSWTCFIFRLYCQEGCSAACVACTTLRRTGVAFRPWFFREVAS